MELKHADPVANYITKLRGLKLYFTPLAFSGSKMRCKLYHKTTWFETRDKNASKAYDKLLQIISQNYVV